MFINGSGKAVLPNVPAIVAALKGNTSLVQTRSERIVIKYDEDNGEIDISKDDNPVATYYDLNEVNKAAREFLDLSMEDPD